MYRGRLRTEAQTQTQTWTPYWGSDSDSDIHVPGKTPYCFKVQDWFAHITYKFIHKTYTKAITYKLIHKTYTKVILVQPLPDNKTHGSSNKEPPAMNMLGVRLPPLAATKSQRHQLTCHLCILHTCASAQKIYTDHVFMAHVQTTIHRTAGR